MAANAPYLLQLPVRSPEFRVLITGGYAIFRSRMEFPFSRKNHATSLRARKVRVVECFAKSTELEALVKDGGDNDNDDGDEVRGDDDKVVTHGDSVSSQRSASASGGDSLSLGIREPVYEVVEVKTCGTVAKRKINRRHLLKSSGLRPRDIRSVDPSLWLTNSMPALLVREHAILLNLGSLRAIVMQERVLIFNYNRLGGKAFIDSLLPRLNPTSTNGGPSMPFVVEVVEAALHSRIQRLEHRLWDLEPRVQALLEVLPNRLTADILEELRISKQKLVELGSRAGALKQMLLDILEDTHEIRHICIIGRNCVLKKENDEIECSVPLDKEIVEEEEEEIEMLLENYLQRCESCHGQAERLLDSAKEMEDSIAVNLSSRRLEVSRFELILQVGTFCVAVGALVAGIFGMNLRSYLEEHVFAFWLTTAGIIVGAVLAFYLMYWYLRTRKIL
ncbi:magnesium transporter MRS2-11, chloroplastic isoform X1 [Solanum verrucosum]|uniref:magnesium transporter MRS2-11, chloroplastic isoform X1 n=1 Tax=Solanum verrucosum TaxID=315347 RepID=UPI0020D07346|nr:magnesium transporter MRS2-11, chloroplastic isoform X1 [Solanum verrucosum]